MPQKAQTLALGRPWRRTSARSVWTHPLTVCFLSADTWSRAQSVANAWANVPSADSMWWGQCTCSDPEQHFPFSKHQDDQISIPGICSPSSRSTDTVENHHVAFKSCTVYPVALYIYDNDWDLEPITVLVLLSFLLDILKRKKLFLYSWDHMFVRWQKSVQQKCPIGKCWEDHMNVISIFRKCLACPAAFNTPVFPSTPF